MLSVEEATKAILADASTLEAEVVPLADVSGRVVAEDIAARMTQPPFAASAMDGYAAKFQDAKKGSTLSVIGEAPAGQPFMGEVHAGEAVRIFTGGAVPAGADHIIIQEDVTRTGDSISIVERQSGPRHIRAAGIDFKEGDVLVRAGETLHEIHGSILAAANVPCVRVVRRPKVCLFSNGDELIEPGGEPALGQIVNSNHYALSAMINSWGGRPVYLGCAADTEKAISQFFEDADDADIIMPIGGASVGDYDYVRSAFAGLGGKLVFEKVAVRPGKPTWYGRMGNAHVVGLPGNPASAIVTCAVFVKPLVAQLAGLPSKTLAVSAKSRVKLPANGFRETYLRATAFHSENGDLHVEPVANQDSSLLSPFAEANALIRREADALAVAEGEYVQIIWLRR